MRGVQAFHRHSEKKENEKMHMDTPLNVGLVKLSRLAALAQSLYIDSMTVRNGRDDRIFASACDKMPDEPSQLLREVAYEATGRGPGSLFRRGIVSAFLEDAAFDIVIQKSLSAYWYWRIIAASAAHAQSLPLTVADVTAGIETVRAAHCVDGIGRAEALAHRLASYDAASLRALIDAGVVYVHTEWSGSCPNCRTKVERLKKNPIFLSFDELFYAPGESLPMSALD